MGALAIPFLLAAAGGAVAATEAGGGLPPFLTQSGKGAALDEVAPVLLMA